MSIDQYPHNNDRSSDRPAGAASAPAGGDALDRQFMAMALMLARRGLGTTSPNPSVGAVIVQATGDAGSGAAVEVVGRGWTQAGGRPHGEVEALARAGGKARGACLYVTLEPCSHHGRTPPCAEALIAAGIARAVVAIRDPDSRVAGKGLARLRAAGIEVLEGVLADEAGWLTAGHILRVSHDRPFVQLKLALSRDGLIAAGTGRPVWVTGPMARRRGHLLRAEADAILVGRGTVAADDPALTCRLPGLAGRSPMRVVLDSDLKIAADARLVATANETPTVIFCANNAAAGIGAAAGAGAVTAGAAAKAVDLRRHGVQIVEVERSAAGLAAPAVLVQLAAIGVTRLLIEGGPLVARSFLEAGLVDELVLFCGCEALGDSGLSPLGEAGLEAFADSARWRLADQRNLNGDQMSIYQNRTSLTMLQASHRPPAP